MFFLLFLKCRQRHWPSCLRLLCLLASLTPPVAMGAEQALTLADAAQRTLAQHPQLQISQWRLAALEASREGAGLRPQYELAATAENFAGRGDHSGSDGAEVSLSISSVIELGAKRSARLGVADSHTALATAEEQAAALDLLAQVTQAFIAALSLQEKLQIARDASALAEESLASVQTLVARGAAPKAESLRAEAALLQARIQEAALATELENRKFSLASLWRAEHVEFAQLQGDLFHFVQPEAFDVLYQRATRAPAIEVFAQQAHLRDAQEMLARSQAVADVRWSIGIRRFEASGDSALTAGMEVPLFTQRRNRTEVKQAHAQREAMRHQRDEALIKMRARLFESWQTFTQSRAAAQQMRAEVIPLLRDALVQTRAAYASGRYGYTEWVSAQRELLDARSMAIDAATTALLHQALIEQITGEPLELNQLERAPTAQKARN